MYSNQSTNISAVNNSGDTNRSKAAKSGNSSWYTAMANAWGNALDKQADTIINLSENLSSGADSLSATTRLAAESHKLTFLSTAASTANNSAGQALETLAKKQ